VITAAAAVTGAVAGAVGWSWAERGAWLDPLIPPDLRSRTTALSATLLELARWGNVIEPMQSLLALGPDDAPRWHSQLVRLMRIGSSTGRTYATVAAAAAFLAASSGPHDHEQTRRKEKDARS
jgi:hypothetical protein